ncbi:MAG: gliding motility lipoprotein GldD [Paludibacteraceae bacterium]|nr:gliding motility lipoprotein GldD [Paludibacteraceae bacterium]
MKKLLRRVLLLFLLVACCVSCRKAGIPKPYGYFRIDIPEHQYQPAPLPNYPYTFVINTISYTKAVKKADEHYWIDIVYPSLNACVHCSYKPVSGNLNLLTDDAVNFVFSHAIKASAIPEQAFDNAKDQVWGVWFDLEGNTASPLQFFLTDSTHHFFRAALYFNNIPNQDSLAPVTQYIREDMQTLVETFRWK